GRAQPHERIGHGADARKPVEPQAHLGQLGRERGRVRPILLAALDGVVRNEPRVAAAANAAGGRLPAADVRLILVADANRLTVEWRISARREVEDELVAV